MKTDNAIVATLAELVRLPFAPLIELNIALSEDQERRSAEKTAKAQEQAEEDRQAFAGGQYRNDGFRRDYNAFSTRVEALHSERSMLFERLQNGGDPASGPSQLRSLATTYRALARAYQNAFSGYPQVKFEVETNTIGAALELEGLASHLEDILDGHDRSSDSSAMPDPKLLTALDRVGLSLDDLPKLTVKMVQERFRERARRFHPDTKDDSDKAFYEDQMKKLNEAKDMLLQHIGG